MSWNIWQTIPTPASSSCTWKASSGAGGFSTTAARVARSKPIIALKTGRSLAGAKAAMSHTGSLVGEDAIVDLALAAAGIIRVRTLVELLAVSRAFLNFRPMAGPRLGVATATGAFGIIAADACEDHGLELAPFPETLRELEEERIPWHRLGNPVDLWPLGMVTGSFTGVFKRAVAGLLADEHVDAVLGVGPCFTSPRHADLDIPGAVRELHAANPLHKPLALLLYGDEAARLAQVEELAREPDVACFNTMDEAVMGLAATWRYRQFLEAPPPGDFSLPPPSTASRRRSPASRGGAGGGGGPEDPEGLRFAPGPRGPGRRRCRGRGRRAGDGLPRGAEDHLAGMGA